MRESEAVAVIQDLSKRKEERIQAAFSLEKASEESLRVLCNVLTTEPSPVVRHEFAFVLGETGRSDLVAESLMKSVEEDENVFVRHEAILALATLGDKKFR